MSKVVIIGTSNSGKTCYFYGMLRKLQRGVSSYSLRINDSAAYQKLRAGMLRLGDTRLPLDERWPAPSTEMEKYNLDLLYNFKQIDSLEWVDYPGEHVSTADTEFIQLLEGANCLFVCVDGSLLQGDLEDMENIADDFYQQSGMDLCHALMQAEKETGDAFPPVCILITKYDAVSPALKGLENMKTFAKLCFPALFTGGKGKDRMVTICPVSLGTEIAQGGKLAPVNVERPICFATYLMQYALTQEYIKQADSFIAEREGRRQENFLEKIFKPKPKPLSEEQKAAIAELVDNQKQTLKDLRDQLKLLPLFVNGEEIPWPECE